MVKKQEPLGEVYLEFRVIGHSVKVSAVHAATHTEISIVGPTNESREVLENIALRKLRYVLAKNHKDGA